MPGHSGVVLVSAGVLAVLVVVVVVVVMVVVVLYHCLRIYAGINLLPGKQFGTKPFACSLQCFGQGTWGLW